MSNPKEKNKIYTVRLSPAAEMCITRHENKSQAINLAVEAWLACEGQAKRKLKGKFTVPELCSFIDILNSSIIPVSYADSFRHEFEDGCAFEQLEEKWGIKKDVVLAKLDTMSMAEYIVLLLWCREYWDVHEKQSPEEYTKQMA